MLNTSARNWIFIFSFMTRLFLNIEKSISKSPGPVSVLRPTMPIGMVPFGGGAKHEKLIQPEILPVVRLLQIGTGRCIESAPMSEPAASPEISAVKGCPLEALKIPPVCQPFVNHLSADGPEW